MTSGGRFDFDDGGTYCGGWEDGKLENRILPVICLSLPFIAYISRITRASMIETMRTNYIRTAIAKGLPYHKVVINHALKSSMILFVVTHR